MSSSVENSEMISGITSVVLGGEPALPGVLAPVEPMKSMEHIPAELDELTSSFLQVIRTIGEQMQRQVGKMVILPKGYSVTSEMARISELPLGSILMKEDGFEVSSRKLSPDCYYRVPKSSFVIRKLSKNSIALYECFELKTGEFVLHKLLESESE